MNLNTIKSIIFGHAIADALGVPVEFCQRTELVESPVIGMRGYGTFDVPAGTWSDDTSMSLCALEVLTDGICDFDRIMINFGKWLMGEEFTANGEMFDVGIACKNAIIDYHAHHLSWFECGQTSEYSNGNGSLMRIHPFVLYLLTKDKMISEKNIQLIFEASALTHAHMRSKIGCGIYACVLEAIIKEPTKSSIYLGLAKANELFSNEDEFSHYSRIFESNFNELMSDEIKTDGYIVHTFEAALWCLLTTDDYKSCVLKAVNLGEDTDTVAAIAGGLAGALYGYDSIPAEWLNTLLRRDYIDEMCRRFADSIIW